MDETRIITTTQTGEDADFGTFMKGDGCVAVHQ